MTNDLKDILADEDRHISDRLASALQLVGLSDVERASLTEAFRLDTGAWGQHEYLEVLLREWCEDDAVRPLVNGCVRLRGEE